MRALWVSLLVMTSACGDDDSGSRETGELGGLCYPNGTCNVTLFCTSGVCVTGDGGVGSDGTIVIPDSASGCADDSTLEPNDTAGTAFVTPVDSTASFNLVGLALCPVGDKDFYSVSLSSTKDLMATIAYENNTPALTVTIHNAGGTPLANGAATGTAHQVRATSLNLPAGTYLVQVAGATSATNNYSLQLATN